MRGFFGGAAWGGGVAGGGVAGGGEDGGGCDGVPGGDDGVPGGCDGVPGGEVGGSAPGAPLPAAPEARTPTGWKRQMSQLPDPSAFGVQSK